LKNPKGLLCSPSCHFIQAIPNLDCSITNKDEEVVRVVDGGVQDLVGVKTGSDPLELVALVLVLSAGALVVA
jgi:hypothetical protein